MLKNIRITNYPRNLNVKPRAAYVLCCVLWFSSERIILSHYVAFLHLLGNNISKDLLTSKKNTDLIRLFCSDIPSVRTSVFFFFL